MMIALIYVGSVLTAIKKMLCAESVPLMQILHIIINVNAKKVIIKMGKNALNVMKVLTKSAIVQIVAKMMENDISVLMIVIYQMKNAIYVMKAIMAQVDTRAAHGGMAILFV